MTHTLLLRLTGPMQAWGVQSRFSIRDTDRVPTKSGVLGLVCAALGKPRRERPGDGFPTLAKLAALQMGVRVDQPGQLRRDYQTASNVIKAGATRSRIEKGNPELKDTEPSERFYLADAWFTVGLSGDDPAFLEAIDQALGAPRWPLALGRKACPPGLPVRICGSGKPAGLVPHPLARALGSFVYPTCPSRPDWGRPRPAGHTVRLVLDASAVPPAPECLNGGRPRIRPSHSLRVGSSLATPLFSPMHLSRLALNPRHVAARGDLADPYRLHQTLAAVAPDDERLLFRAEPEAPGGPAVLVQTMAEPDWSALPEGYGRVDGPKPFEPNLREGQRLRFRLVANPTVKKKREGRSQGARVPLVHARAPEGHAEVTAGYLDWLDRKAGENGFAVEHVVDAPFEVRTRKRGGHRITLFGVRFDGGLVVSDPDALCAAVRGGVGPAKGLGFGLLSLARG